jgi:hypothetical protein
MARDWQSQIVPLAGMRLLTACEQSRRENTLSLAIGLLAAALPDCDHGELVELTLAELHRLLLHLQRISFGPVLEGYARCPQCDTSMEFSLGVEQALEMLCLTQAQTADWVENGIRMRLRPATVGDVLASVRLPTQELAEEHLLSRCLDLEDAGEACAHLNAARLRFESLNAASELRCTLRCPHCGHEEMWDLDPPHFLWEQACHASRHLLADIHTLAFHYGWSEEAIAGMSPRRREAYLELLYS